MIIIELISEKKIRHGINRTEIRSSREQDGGGWYIELNLMNRETEGVYALAFLPSLNYDSSYTDALYRLMEAVNDFRSHRATFGVVSDAFGDYIAHVLARQYQSFWHPSATAGFRQMSRKDMFLIITRVLEMEHYNYVLWGDTLKKAAIEAWAGVHLPFDEDIEVALSNARLLGGVL